MAAPEALDLKSEPAHILKLYGLDSRPVNWPAVINAEEETYYFSQKCLAARRLLERGVRFVQIWSGNDNGFPRRNWDSHEDVERDHGECPPIEISPLFATSAKQLKGRNPGLKEIPCGQSVYFDESGPMSL